MSAPAATVGGRRNVVNILRDLRNAPHLALESTWRPPGGFAGDVLPELDAAEWQRLITLAEALRNTADRLERFAERALDELTSQPSTSTHRTPVFVLLIVLIVLIIVSRSTHRSP